MAAMEPPWKAALTVPGLKMAPSNIAEYAAASEFHVEENAAPGAYPSESQARNTVGSVNTISTPPTTSAVKIASVVTTGELPCVIAWMISLPVSLGRLAPGAFAGVAVCWSVIAWLRIPGGPCVPGGRPPGPPGVGALWMPPSLLARRWRSSLVSPGGIAPRRVRGCCGAGAGHHQAEFGLGRVGRAEADDLAFVHDGDPVGEGVNLVELGRHDDNGGALVAQPDDLLVHEFDRSDVQSPRGLAGEQHLDVAAHFACD